ncbi:MAG: hypothetical protein ABIW32_01120 [Terrimesophilobacter sp.]
MGDEPPARLSEQVVAAIHDVESSDTAPSPSRRWTLTWLEGRPIAELEPPAHNDVFTTVSVDPEDLTAIVTFGS